MATATDSLQAELQALRRTRKEQTQRLPIPGWNGQLIGVYESLGWRDVREIAIGTEVPAAKELESAADLLVELNVEVEAHANGRVESIGKLGGLLAQFLGVAEELPPDMPLTDRAAVFLIFQNDATPKEAEFRVMRHVNRLSGGIAQAEEEADEEISGNSRAVS